MPTTPSQPALFLDRDGTLIEYVPYLHEPTKVKLLPGVRNALIRALEANCLLFIFTNQSGIGREYFKMEDAMACNQQMLELLQLPPPGITEIKIAPEHPDGQIIYRKPAPRYILENIEAYALDKATCFMIGDSAVDMYAGINAKIQSILVRTGIAGDDLKLQSQAAEYVIPLVSSLEEAVELALRKTTQVPN